MIFYGQHLKQYAAQCLAELFATFLSILLGDLSVAQNKFSKPENQSSFGVSLSFSVGVYVALMVAGPISGLISLLLSSARHRSPQICLISHLNCDAFLLRPIQK